MIENLATDRFSMRISPEEKTLLAELSKTFRRSRSDTIRLLINDAHSKQVRKVGRKSSGNLPQAVECQPT